jgi:hypothetical protein
MNYELNGMKTIKKSCKIVRRGITLLAEIVTILSIGGLCFAYCDYRNTQNEIKGRRIEKTDRQIEIAKMEFENKNFDKALNLFVEIQLERPNDSTGYHLFIDKANRLLQITNKCDSIIKQHLNRAKILHNTQEINDLLNNCR